MVQERGEEKSKEKKVDQPGGLPLWTLSEHSLLTLCVCVAPSCLRSCLPAGAAELLSCSLYSSLSGKKRITHLHHPPWLLLFPVVITRERDCGIRRHPMSRTSKPHVEASFSGHSRGRIRGILNAGPLCLWLRLLVLCKFLMKAKDYSK